MKGYRKFALTMVLIQLALLILCNGLLFSKENSSRSKLYRVEAKRIAQVLESVPPENLNLSDYSTIIDVRLFRPEETLSHDYVVEQAGGRLYRISYDAPKDNSMIWYINFSLIAMMSVSLFVLWYTDRHILAPFERMSDLPAQLAKGHLTIPLKAEKNKFFGKFLWGLDMLRQTLEDNRERELSLQKEKQTLILSLSHDIKTPLSAIELYAKALELDLYHVREKKAEMIRGIFNNTAQIQGYVSKITTASGEEFLPLEITPGECYLREVTDFIRDYYREKLALIHTDFAVESPPNCLVKGDGERLIEVLQNIMENAVKYGNGAAVSLTCEQEEDCCLLHVFNTGSGVSPTELPHLFDAFYRGSNHNNVKGSGLGLYICKSLMKKWMEMYSQNLLTTGFV